MSKLGLYTFNIINDNAKLAELNYFTKRCLLKFLPILVILINFAY